MGYDDRDPLDFILDNVKQNISFLQRSGRLSADAASQIDSLLSSPASSSATPIAHAFSPPVAAPLPPRAVSATPTPQQPQRVRALYDYDAPGDLNFRVGDVIELTPRPSDNDDWWTGRLNGQTGLFPSNYAEKISTSAPGPSPMSPMHMSSPAPVMSSLAHRLPPPPSSGPAAWNEKPPMQSSYSTPPYPGYPQQGPGPNAYYGSSQPAPNMQGGAPVPGSEEEQAKKKNKFGKLGSTVGNAAAGGLGFGAGAAIGGGIVNAIF